MSINASLYDRIGGTSVVPTLVDDFYRKLLADPDLAPFFAWADMDKLKRMQIEFLSSVLGGPTRYPVSSVAHAHRHLKLSLVDYQRFAQHLFSVLSSYKLTEQECYEVLNRVDRYTNDVVSHGVEAAD